MKQLFLRCRLWLSGLSFRTGVVVLLLCVLSYVLSFAQFALPSSVASIETKGVLWVIFYGLAKTLQYTGLLIVGKEGWKRIKTRWLRRSTQSAKSKAITEVSTETKDI